LFWKLIGNKRVSYWYPRFTTLLANDMTRNRICRKVAAACFRCYQSTVLCTPQQGWKSL